jgi:hypothetical protein
MGVMNWMNNLSTLSHSRERFAAARESVEVYVYIRAETVHGDETKVSAKISGILNGVNEDE